ncbi:T9SS type A sorting domain-containing protein [candidate division KSB1 bacterium]
MKSKILSCLTLVLVLSLVLGGSAYAQDQVYNVDYDTMLISGSKTHYATQGVTPTYHLLNFTMTMDSVYLDTLYIYFPIGTDTVAADTMLPITIGGTNYYSTSIASAEWLDNNVAAHQTAIAHHDVAPYIAEDEIGITFQCYRLIFSGLVNVSTDSTITIKFKGMTNDDVLPAVMNAGGDGNRAIVATGVNAYIDTILVMASTSVNGNGAADAANYINGSPANWVGLRWALTPSSPTVTALAATGTDLVDTVGQAFGTGTVTFTIADADGNVLIDSLADVYLKSSTSSGVVGVGGGKFYVPFQTHTVSAQKDTLKAHWNPTTSAFEVITGRASYNKAVDTYFRGYYGASSIVTSQYSRQFATTPYEMTLSPTSQSSNVTVNAQADIFTVTVKDTFANLCKDDSLYLTTNLGTGIIQYDTDDGFATPTTLGGSGALALDIVGKAYVRMTAGTVAGTDSLIFQVRDDLVFGNDGANPSDDLTSALTRKAVTIPIIAGALHTVALYPEAGDLVDAAAGDYYDTSAGFGETGKVRAGDSMHFRILLLDEYNNKKDATSSDFTNVTLATKRGGTFSGFFLDETTKDTDANFPVDLIGFRYKTSTTATGAAWRPAATTAYVKDTVTITYSSIANNTDFTEFATKGNVPAAAYFLTADGNIADGMPVDTVQVDSLYTVKAYLFDAYGNHPDTLLTVTFSLKTNTQVTADITDNAGMKANSTYTATPGGTTTFSDVLSTDTDTTKRVRLSFDAANYPDSVGAWAYFKSDSAKGYAVVEVSYGGTALDSIKLIKHASQINTLDLKFYNSVTGEVDVDTTATRGTAGALIAGMTRTARIRFYDDNLNIVVIPADSGRYVDRDIHKGNFRILNGNVNYLMIDTLYQTNMGNKKQLGAFDDTRYPETASYPSSYDLLATDSYVYLTFTTIGGDSGFQKAFARITTFANLEPGVTIGDTILFRTWLPSQVATYTIAADGLTDQMVGSYIPITVAPLDQGKNPIYSFKYNYFEISLLDGSAAALEDTLKAVGSAIQTTWVHWQTGGNDGPINLDDSTAGIAYSAGVNASATGDTTFTLDADTFWVSSSKTLVGAQIRIKSTSFDDNGNPTVSKDTTVDLDLDWYPAAPDTIDMSFAGSLYAQTKADMTVAIKDQYKNDLVDSTYVIRFNSNQQNVGLSDNLIIDGTGTVEVVPQEAGTISFYAQLISRADNGNSDNAAVFGERAGLTVAAAVLNAPTAFAASDNPSDNGGYVLLAFTASVNHPGMTGTSDEDLAIDYYQVYRSTSNDLTTAVNWAVIPATPITSGTGTTVRAVVSTRGDKSSNAYYWVSAVKGDLPPEFSASDDAVDAANKANELGYLFGYEIEAKAAGVSGVYAIESDGKMISSADGPNRAIGAANTALTADFTSDGTVGLADLSIFAFAYGNTSEYELLYDLDANATVGLSDLSMFAGQYGTSLNSAPVINNGVNVNTTSLITPNNANSGEFTIDVSLEALAKMSGYEFSVVFDDNYEFVSATHSDFINTNGGSSPVNIVKEEDGRVILANVIVDGSNAVEGDGSVATLTFIWVGDEVTEMTFEGITVMDDNGRTNTLENFILEKPIVLPTDYALDQNYPNPFNPETTIKYAMPVSGNVKIVLYNILGQKVRTLVENDMKAGFHKVVWNGRNDLGVKVASGMYIYMIKAGDFRASKKMVLMK